MADCLPEEEEIKGFLKNNSGQLKPGASSSPHRAGIHGRSGPVVEKGTPANTGTV